MQELLPGAGSRDGSVAEHAFGDVRGVPVGKLAPTYWSWFAAKYSRDDEAMQLSARWFALRLWRLHADGTLETHAGVKKLVQLHQLADAAVWRQYSVVLVDEAQDVDAAVSWIVAGGRVMAAARLRYKH